LGRVLGHFGADLDELPEPPRIFKLIQKVGRVSDLEMYRTFNMGVGFAIACPDAEADGIIRTLRRHRQTATRIGQVAKKPGIRISDRSLN